MTDELKQILCNLILRHGRELVREPKRLEGMLNDACAGQHRGARVGGCRSGTGRRATARIGTERR